jgi:hypothetical protein
MNMQTFTRRPVLTTNISTVLIGSAMIGTFVLVPHLAQLPKGGDVGFGLSATEAGLLLAPAASSRCSSRRWSAGSASAMARSRRSSPAAS